jgi:endo-1,4-beta-xylanase
VLVAAGPPGAGAAQAEESLARAAARNGRFYGAAARIDQIRSDGELGAAILRECATMTPELELKWAAVEPQRGAALLGPVDELIAFARANGLAVHGHTLLWHRSVPAWAVGALRERRDWTPVRSHISSMMTRYGDAIERWDVVNEPIETGRRADGLRQSVFLEAFGPDYIRRALEEARAVAPRARLMVNEYGLEYDTPLERERRHRFLGLLARLRLAGAPLDGVGIQGHLDLAKGPFSEKAFAAFLQDIADLGLEIVISELDVKEHDYGAPAAERDRRVAAAVTRYLDVAFAQRAVKGLVTWGLSDRYSWLEVTPEDLERHAGLWKDGDGPGLNRGLPLDAAMRPKPMHEAIRAAFRRQPLG